MLKILSRPFHILPDFSMDVDVGKTGLVLVSTGLISLAFYTMFRAKPVGNRLGAKLGKKTTEHVPTGTLRTPNSSLNTVASSAPGLKRDRS